MISPVTATEILTERSKAEQLKLLGKLTERDTKYLLKIAMGLLRGEDVA